jgi:hypothetical protein
MSKRRQPFSPAVGLWAEYFQFTKGYRGRNNFFAGRFGRQNAAAGGGGRPPGGVFAADEGRGLGECRP